MANREVSNARQSIRDFSKSLSFNGSSDYATCPVVPSTTGFSLGFWYYKRTQGGALRVIDCMDAGPANGFYIKQNLAADNLLWFSIYDSAEKGVYSTPLANGKWYHIVCTFKVGEVKMYVNGVLANTNTTSVSAMTASAQLITIGKRATSGSSYSNVDIDELVFQNTDTPWTQTQIDDLYYRGKIPTGVTAWYKFNDNVTDQSGNGNNLTLSGTSYSTNRPNISPRTTVTNSNVMQRSTRNLVPNPSFTTNTTAWTAGGASSITRQASGGVDGGPFGRIVCTAAAGDRVYYQRVADQGSGLKNKRLVISFYAKSTSNSPLYISGDVSYPTGFDWGTLVSAAVPTTWTRYTINGIIKSSATSFLVTGYFAAKTDYASGSGTVDIDQVMFELLDTNASSSNYPSDYFDGSSTNCSWAGTANNSESIRATGTVRYISGTRTVV